MKKFLSIALYLTFHAGCAAYQAKAPAGFAAFKPTHAQTHASYAVASDGVVWRVRQESNTPYADIGFWSVALKKRMVDAGYTVLKEETISTHTHHHGNLLEMSAPLTHQDVLFVVAVFCTPKHIFIIESSGEFNALQTHRNAIESSIKSLVF